MIFYSEIYSELTLPDRHRFPIQKYRDLYNALQSTELSNFIVKANTLIDTTLIQLCHDKDYVDAFIDGKLSPSDVKKMGFPWSKVLVNRTLISLNNTLLAAKHALRHGIGVNLSGGYHHAQKNLGAGFCIFNDFAVVAHTLIHLGLADTVLIFDCDVHHGDGTATLCQENQNIITCSIHCEQNFPRIKPNSDYDFPLPVGTQDSTYIETVQQALELCFRLHKPDIVLYNAGADIYCKDELGHFDISLAGVRTRDSKVLNYCLTKKTPVVATLGGGYQRNSHQLTQAHLQLFLALLDNLKLMV
ncbi:Histone deacetylase/AcuC/AphA family protein [Pseudoalteromonas luteoviolacea B = ATCC 29581]|nr:Histone deacetylase/AcuC/AphA family protein [Pseudoalteromonas luteoviolacea B = ATCC 29581]